MMIAIILCLTISQIGDRYFDLGNFDLAHDYYKTAIRIEGEDRGTMLRLGQTCCLLEKYSEAKEVLSSLNSKEARRWLGFAYFQSGEYKEAARILKPVTGEPITNYYYAVSLYQIGDYQASIDVFNQLVKVFPEDEIQFWKSLILTKLDNKEEALGLLNKVEKDAWWGESAQYLDSYLRDQLDLPILYQTGDRVLLLRARKEFHSGDITKAARILDSVSNYRGYKAIGLAICYIKLNWYHKAIKELSSLPDTGWIGTYYHHLLGEAYLNLRKYEEARKNFRAIGSAGLEGLVITFFRSGYYDSVVYYIEEIKTNHPEIYDDEKRFLMAQSLFNLKKYPEVKSICREILISNQETNIVQQAYVLIGEADLANGQPDSARRTWKEFVNSLPASPLAGLAMKRIGDSYYKDQDYKNAIDAYEGINNLPHTPSIIEDAGFKIEIARYRLGQYHNYVTVLKTFLKKFPDGQRSPRVSLEIGDIYKKAGKLTEALRWYEKTIELYPLIKLKALQRIVKIQEITNDIEGLKKTYLLIIETSDDPEGIQQLARLYLSSQNYDSAILWFERLSHNEKFHDLAYYELAKINRRVDRIREAEFFLRPIVENDSPYKTDAILELAEILRETGRFDEAKRILSKISDNPSSHLILGEIEFLSGNYFDSKNEFIRACSLFGEDRNSCAEALIQAGDAALKGGNKGEALKLYDRALLMALDPRIKIRAQRKREGTE